MSDDELIAFLRDVQGYLAARRIHGGELIGVCRMAYTFGLMVGCDEHGYKSRYCYQHVNDALRAFGSWNGEGDPPGPWIKHKGLKTGDRLGPGAIDNIQARGK